MFYSRIVEQLSSIPNNNPINLEFSNNDPIDSVDDAVRLFNQLKGNPYKNKDLIREAIQKKYIQADDTTKEQLDQLMSNLIQLRYFINNETSSSKDDSTVEITDTVIDYNDVDQNNINAYNMQTCIWNICKLCEKDNLNLNVNLTLSLVFNKNTGNQRLWYFGGHREMPRNLEDLFHFANGCGCQFRLTSKSRGWIFDAYPKYDPDNSSDWDFKGTNSNDSVTNLFSMQQKPQSQNMTNHLSEPVAPKRHCHHNHKLNTMLHGTYQDIKSSQGSITGKYDIHTALG